MNPYYDMIDRIKNDDGTLPALLVTASIILAVYLFVGLAVYVLSALTVFSLSNKAQRKCGLLAWVPVFNFYYCSYVLMDIAHQKPFLLFNGKIMVGKRKISFLIYFIFIVVKCVFRVIAFFVGLVPYVGWILSFFINLIPTVLIAFMNYVYLRDVGEIFKTNNKSNRVWSATVTTIDAVLNIGLARLCYLVTMLKDQPVIKPI